MRKDRIIHILQTSAQKLLKIFDLEFENEQIEDQVCTAIAQHITLINIVCEEIDPDIYLKNYEYNKIN